MFEDLYQNVLKTIKEEEYGVVSSEMTPLLRVFHDEMLRCPADVDKVADAIVKILEFLVSVKGRTKGNCWAVDLFISLSDSEFNEAKLPDKLWNIINDMGGDLHDTFDDSETAHNFESLPEDLLERIRTFKKEIVNGYKKNHTEPLKKVIQNIYDFADKLIIFAIISAGAYCYGLATGSVLAGGRYKYDVHMVHKSISPVEFASCLQIWAILTGFLLTCGVLLRASFISDFLARTSIRFEKSSIYTKPAAWWGYLILVAMIATVIWAFYFFISCKI